MSSHRMVALGATVLVTVVACVVIATSRPAVSSVPTARLEGGADSVEGLIDRLVVALSTNDKGALDRLRVNEQEYRDVIVPGTVDKGQPLRTVDPTTFTYFWGVLDKKSRLYGDMLMQRFAGQRYTRTEFHFSRDPLSYESYRAFGSLRVTLVGEDRQERQLETGWIAEVGGTYKFVGYQSQ